MKEYPDCSGGCVKEAGGLPKKIHNTIHRKEWLGKFLPVILVFIEAGGVFSSRGSSINFTVGTGILFSLLKTDPAPNGYSYLFLLSLSHCDIIMLASVPGGVRKRIAGVSVQLFWNIPEEHAAADATKILIWRMYE